MKGEKNNSVDSEALASTWVVPDEETGRNSDSAKCEIIVRNVLELNNMQAQIKSAIYALSTQMKVNPHLNNHRSYH